MVTLKILCNFWKLCLMLLLEMCYGDIEITYSNFSKKVRICVYWWYIITLITTFIFIFLLNRNNLKSTFSPFNIIFMNFEKKTEVKFVDFQNSLQKQTNHLKMQHRKSFPHFCLINGDVYFVNISKCSRYKHKKNPSNIFSNWKWCWDFSMEISPNSLWLVDFAFFAFTLTNSPKISLNVDEKKKLTKNANINFDWMSFFFLNLDAKTIRLWQEKSPRETRWTFWRWSKMFFLSS